MELRWAQDRDGHRQLQYREGVTHDVPWSEVPIVRVDECSHVWVWVGRLEAEGETRYVCSQCGLLKNEPPVTSDAQDAARYRGLISRFGRSMSPHMDSTFEFSISVQLGRANTFDDAVDRKLRAVGFEIPDTTPATSNLSEGGDGR